MNINVVFAWPVLTTVFTIFLYWNGFWYNQGYAEFYNYNLAVFDLPIPLLLLEGLIKNVSHVIFLLMILIGISFITSFNKAQWKYAIYSTFSIVVGVSLFFYYIIKHFTRKIPPFRLTRWLKTKIKAKLIIIKPKLRGTARLLILTGHKCKRFMQKYQLTEADVRHKSFGPNAAIPTHSFSFSMFLHYFILLFLVVCLYFLFKAGQDLAIKAKHDAEKQFTTGFAKMKAVKVKGRPVNLDLRSTNLCFKGFCLITDKNKNVQLYDMKEVTILNKVTDDKKAP
ncbi:hypothetical protein HCY66_06135 [Acinetobacter radioresistens]|uniref:hypothetical protein n=1 Tax=Acinetobacter radioresistens TaxID=40216 RepID=UPI0020065543|nr:hypothetical protein [Acinetobacter radioresistens]MCK4089664.1 hypothetical protein [Acinetobacter radioresistens]